MSTPRYNMQHFTVKSDDGTHVYFTAYTTHTRAGFCHTVTTWAGGRNITDTKISYLNRTWESYDYETALKRAAQKVGKEIYNKVCAREFAA